MADATPIEYTDATWNVVTGCSVVSPGCTNCYAMKLAGTRLRNHPSRAGLTVAGKAGPVWNGQVRFNADWLDQPLRWTRPRRIFVAAHGDLFHDGVTDDQLDLIFAVMALCPQHTFQVLTKRPERMRAYIGDSCGRIRSGRIMAIRGAREDKDMAVGPSPNFQPEAPWWPLPNVWLGVSVEDQTRADERIPILLATPAAVRWISAEPLLGPIDLTRVVAELGFGQRRVNALRAGEAAASDALNAPDGMIPPTPFPAPAGLDWVVAGGESGPGARPMHPDWARQLRDQCAAAGVPFLFKQWGEWTPGENAQNTIGKAVETADWFNDRWSFQRLTAGDCEGMHIDDEPTLYRAGKKAAGRLLDGVQHDGYPEVRHV